MEPNPQAPQQQPVQTSQPLSGNPWPQESQQWFQYLLQLSDALRAVDDPVTIEEIATRLAMQSLDADRCYYCQVVDGQAIISRDARRGHLPSVAGTYSLSSFPLLKKVVEEGRPFIVEDAHTTPFLDEELRAICRQMHVIAFLNIPVVKQGKPIGVLCLVQSAPRRWTELEIQLQIETAERTWAAVERAKAEAALRQSEDKYRTLFNSIDEGFSLLELIFDEQGHVVDYWHRDDNAAFNRMTGINDPVGKRMSELVRDLEPAWYRSLEGVYRTGEATRMEYPVQPLGRWYSCYLSRVGGEGSPFIAAVYDEITERKQAEERQHYLLGLSDVLRTLSSPDELLGQALKRVGEYLDLDRVTYNEIDPAVTKYTVRANYVRQGFVSKVGVYPMDPFHQTVQNLRRGQTFVVNDTQDEPFSPAEKAIHRGMNVGAYVVVPLVKDGRWLCNLVAHTRQPRHWKQLDITLLEETAERIWAAVERAKAEEDLRESQKRFESIANLVPDLLWDSGPDGATTWYNQRWLEYTGQRFEEANRWGWTDAIHPDDRDDSTRRYWQAVATGEAFRQEHRIRRHDGAYRWFVVSAVPLKDQRGQVVRMYGAATDIHEAKRMEASLRQAARRKDEFLAMLAHELRNPMATLHNTLLLLELTRGQDETLPLDRALAMMSREVSHLNRMVDDLLDVGRISQGKIQLTKDRLDLTGLIREALEAARAQFASQGHRLLIQLPQEPLWIDGDRTRLTQVVRNLVTNAAKYTPDGGQISERLEQENRQAVLRIRDNGIGLAADQLEVIFEVFVQVSSTLDRPQGGLGLGLAVVKQLVQLHGGQVSVQSAGLGQGSDFRVHLPLRPNEPVPMASAGVGKGPTQKTWRILVVDDNADLALTTAMLLRVKKYEAHTCLSGSDALQMVTSLQPDAVLLDLGMPGMDGYQTCRGSRELAWGQQGVIVALSGYGQEDDKKRTREWGFDGHLVKPINLQTLTALLDNLLNTAESGE